MTLGLVCDACSAFNPLGGTACTDCGVTLGVLAKSPPPEFSGGPATMSERRCPSCNAAVTPNNKFCGNCGKPMPSPESRVTSAKADRQAPKTMFFSVLSTS